MTHSLLPSGPSLAELDERARDIFRRVVEGYIETGEPIGSRTLSKGGIHLSPASIRNTMQDLTQLGLLGAPHISAGRLPTHAGLRLFVDGLMEVGDVGEEDRKAIESRLMGRSFDEALNEASAILSGLARGAGVVVTPVRDAGVKHVEFVALGGDQALAVMVFEDGVVENRLMNLRAGVTPSSLQEASNFLNARMRGKTLGEAGASGWANVTCGAVSGSAGPAAGKLRADCRTLPASAHPAIGASANSGANSHGIQIRPPPTRAPPGTRAPAGSRRWGDGVGTGDGS